RPLLGSTEALPAPAARRVRAGWSCCPGHRGPAQGFGTRRVSIATISTGGATAVVVAKPDTGSQVPPPLIWKLPSQVVVRLTSTPSAALVYTCVTSWSG